MYRIFSHRTFDFLSSKRTVRSNIFGILLSKSSLLEPVFPTYFWQVIKVYVCLDIFYEVVKIPLFQILSTSHLLYKRIDAWIIFFNTL